MPPSEVAPVHLDLPTRFSTFLEKERGPHGRPFQIASLRRFLRENPQVRQGKLINLLSSGWAVDLQTGVERSHLDYDFVSFLDTPVKAWGEGGLDFTTPHHLHGEIKLDPSFLKQTAVSVAIMPSNPPRPDIDTDSEPILVHTVCPAVIMIMKLADDKSINPNKPETPRIWDIHDVLAILRSDFPTLRYWDAEVTIALAGLPKNQKDVVLKRLEILMKVAHTGTFDEAFMRAAHTWPDPINNLSDSMLVRRAHDE